ncbi:ABC transporter ATP-binding protein [Risungbinella massiliensis]|uniref:ABC transporter ATP-binding protein n=1 Tax=Risungbinella massiliensis TaxID=1329796 RepID=UPI0005CC5BED|nr:ABC transporter ATP-binding protein [Risungbinella massiliensis]
MTKPILITKGLTKRIGSKTLVKDLNLEIYPGEVYGFLGPNGAGKTTTIRMIMGLMSISEGEAWIAGKNIAQNFEQAIQSVGGIVENPEMYKFLSGYRNLLHYARISRSFRNKEEQEERIAEVTKLVGLEGRIHEKVKRYSLGMRQRLGIAQALLHRPKLLILDEPTNGLDPSGIRELRDHLKRLAHEQNLAVLVSSHLLSEMELMCDRIAIIQNGQLVDVKEIQEFVQEGENRVLFRVKEIESVMSILQNEAPDLPIKVTKNGVLLDLEEKQIPVVNEALVRAGIAVYGIQPETKSLEDQFLEITEGKKVVNY